MAMSDRMPSHLRKLVLSFLVVAITRVQNMWSFSEEVQRRDGIARLCVPQWDGTFYPKMVPNTGNEHIPGLIWHGAFFQNRVHLCQSYDEDCVSGNVCNGGGDCSDGRCVCYSDYVLDDGTCVSTTAPTTPATTRQTTTSTSTPASTTTSMSATTTTTHTTTTTIALTTTTTTTSTTTTTTTTPTTTSTTTTTTRAPTTTTTNTPTTTTTTTPTTITTTTPTTTTTTNTPTTTTTTTPTTTTITTPTTTTATTTTTPTTTTTTTTTPIRTTTTNLCGADPHCEVNSCLIGQFYNPAEQSCACTADSCPAGETCDSNTLECMCTSTSDGDSCVHNGQFCDQGTSTCTCNDDSCTYPEVCDPDRGICRYLCDPPCAADEECLPSRGTYSCKPRSCTIVNWETCGDECPYGKGWKFVRKMKGVGNSDCQYPGDIAFTGECRDCPCFYEDTDGKEFCSLQFAGESYSEILIQGNLLGRWIALPFDSLKQIIQSALDNPGVVYITPLAAGCKVTHAVARYADDVLSVLASVRAIAIQQN